MKKNKVVPVIFESLHLLKRPAHLPIPQKLWMDRKWGFKVHTIIKAMASEISRAIKKVLNKTSDVLQMGPDFYVKLQSLEPMGLFSVTVFSPIGIWEQLCLYQRKQHGEILIGNQWSGLLQNTSMWFWKQLPLFFLLWRIINHLLFQMILVPNMHFSTLIILNQSYLRKNFLSSLK